MQTENGQFVFKGLGPLSMVPDERLDVLTKDWSFDEDWMLVGFAASLKDPSDQEFPFDDKAAVKDVLEKFEFGRQLLRLHSSDVNALIDYLARKQMGNTGE